MRKDGKADMSITVGKWNTSYFVEDVQMRTVRLNAEKEHSHPVPDPIESKRYEMDDGCVFEFRVATWSNPS